eukprot:CAMPEP_0171882196 /NCGR_PEP_ID=MMETSP0992-20121227/39451_1 /TAXON_ID=483369 /ORGANISM="non described non described, Strain CCMP2098" /LENGTH=44 /DNA_ID= /DNA_START= /DNA_END= /DNA_ORIENTATION=
MSSLNMKCISASPKHKVSGSACAAASEATFLLRCCCDGAGVAAA